MARVKDESLGKSLCAALGIEADRVDEIRIDCRVGDSATCYIKAYIKEAQCDELIAIANHYYLVAKDEEVA